MACATATALTPRVVKKQRYFLEPPGHVGNATAAAATFGVAQFTPGPHDLHVSEEHT